VYEIEDMYQMELLLPPDLMTEIDAALKRLGHLNPKLKNATPEVFARHAINYALYSMDEDAT
jgi:hypothetical protein